MLVLERHEDWIALYKEAGDHVHPPEKPGRHPVPREKILLYRVRDEVGCHVYPVHRLDAGTCGVLLMALNPEAASCLARQFQERQVEKTYHALVRGWPEPQGRIDLPLESDSTGLPLEAVTHFRRLARLELEGHVGSRHVGVRASLLELRPLTGRYHQLRRHLNRTAHPIIGDATHGDSRHNRFYRERHGLAGLCLKAQSLNFTDPRGERRHLTAPDDEKWVRLRRLVDSARAEDMENPTNS